MKLHHKESYVKNSEHGKSLTEFIFPLLHLPLSACIQQGQKTVKKFTSVGDKRQQEKEYWSLFGEESILECIVSQEWIDPILREIPSM